MQCSPSPASSAGIPLPQEEELVCPLAPRSRPCSLEDSQLSVSSQLSEGASSVSSGKLRKAGSAKQKVSLFDFLSLKQLQNKRKNSM